MEVVVLKVELDVMGDLAAEDRAGPQAAPEILHLLHLVKEITGEHHLQVPEPQEVAEGEQEV